MCGFAGIVAWNDRYRATRETLERMSSRLAHRGPDGQGLYLDENAVAPSRKPHCGLAHRRLSVIDLDIRASQPFSDESRARWLVYNGEIYNYRDLRDELSLARPQHRWRTESDTEVLLLALEVWGTDALRRLNGMYAFALWDSDTGQLLLARDRMGQKPLYYVAINDAGQPYDSSRRRFGGMAAFAFASELAALRAVPWFDTSVDGAALSEYLRWGYIPAPYTIYSAARKLPPATWARLDGCGGECAEYFDPNAPCGTTPYRGSLDNAVNETRRLVTRAVHRQVVSDVPIGCFLSGGIDSSVVAAAMRGAGRAGAKVRTFSIGVDDPAHDESSFAAAVAKHLGTTHQTFVVQPSTAEELPKLAAVYGEPFGAQSALAVHCLARAARGDVVVALTGDGGDELFGGYLRYRAVRIARCIRQLPGALRSLIASPLWQAIPEANPREFSARLKRLLLAARLDPAQCYASYVRLFDEATVRGLLGSNHKDANLVETMYERFLSGSGPERRDDVQAALAVDRITYLPDNLLAKVDHATMLHALEARCPFMDHDLVGFAAGLPTNMLLQFGGGKRLLRLAFAAELPAEVFNRNKTGFTLPIGRWLREDLRPMLNDLLFARDSFIQQNLDTGEARRLVDDHHVCRADHGNRLYALMMLELWWRSTR